MISSCNDDHDHDDHDHDDHDDHDHEDDGDDDDDNDEDNEDDDDKDNFHFDCNALFSFFSPFPSQEYGRNSCFSFY